MPPSETGEERCETPTHYYVLAYEDARRERPIRHEHVGTTVFADGAKALGQAEVAA